MNPLKKIDATLDKAAASLARPSRRRATKMVLYCALAAALIWAPYALARHVYSSGFYLVSVEREAKAGKQAAMYLEREMELKRANSPVSRYITEIGTQITRENNPWQAQFSFSVVEDNETINAFALPGGRIYITTGMLDRLDNEAELAAVLAHEAAHVTRRHYARNLGRRMMMSWVKKFLGVTEQAILKSGSFLTTNVTLLKMRQEDELEADYQGALYMYELDYDPTGEITLIRKLLSLETKTPDVIRVMAITHPPSRERLEAMVSLKESLPSKQTLKLEEDRYRQIIRKKQSEAPPLSPAPPRAKDSISGGSTPPLTSPQQISR